MQALTLVTYMQTVTPMTCMQTVTPMTRVQKRIQGAEGVCDPSDPLEPEFVQTLEICSKREFWGSFGLFSLLGSYT